MDILEALEFEFQCRGYLVNGLHKDEDLSITVLMFHDTRLEDWMLQIDNEGDLICIPPARIAKTVPYRAFELADPDAITQLFAFMEIKN